MFLLFVLSLSVLFYFICMEFNKQGPPEAPLTGKCPGCLELVVSGWLVCPECRTVLRNICSACGKAHDRWARYCPWCRHKNEKAAT